MAETEAPSVLTGHPKTIIIINQCLSVLIVICNAAVMYQFSFCWHLLYKAQGGEEDTIDVKAETGNQPSEPTVKQEGRESSHTSAIELDVRFFLYAYLVIFFFLITIFSPKA